MKFVCLVSLLLLMPCSTFGATYYVRTDGNDSANGTTDATAWQTIAKVNASTFASRDQILFKRGDLWDEQLKVPASSIVIGSYGTGANAVIDGGDEVTDWVSSGSNQWQASVPVQPFAVWIDDAPGIGLWSWSSGILTVYSASEPMNVEAAQRSSCIEVSGQNYVVIENLELLHANGCNLALKNAMYCVVQSCTIHDSNMQGILMWSYAGKAGGGHAIESNEIYNSGISRLVGGSGSAIQTLNNPGLYVTNIANKIQNNNVHDVYGDSHDHGFYCESVGGDVIQGNVWTNCPGDAIKLNGTTSNTVASFNICVNCKGSGIAVVAAGSGQVLNNTIYQCGVYPGTSPHAGIWYQPTSNGPASGCTAIIKNNIIVGAGIAIHFPDANVATGLTSNNNLFFGGCYVGEWSVSSEKTLQGWQKASGQDANSINANPLFVNASAGNFHLQSTSPCRTAKPFIGVYGD